MLAIILTSVVGLTLLFNALPGTKAKCKFLEQLSEQHRGEDETKMSPRELRAKNNALRYYNTNCI